MWRFLLFSILVWIVDTNRNVSYIQDSLLSLSQAKYMNSVQMSTLPEETLLQNLRQIFNLPALEQNFTFGGRFGGGDGVGSSFPQLNGDGSVPSNIAIAAQCKPDLVTVPLVLQNKTDTMIFWPTCTRAHQCGGCCSHHLLSCQPTKTRLEKKTVIVIDLMTNQDSKQVVQVEQHDECKCQCIVQPQHCTPLQRYEEDRCECVCKKRKYCGHDKTWDKNSCSCKCRHKRNCTTGLFFNNRTCRCELEKEMEPSTSRPPFHNRRRSRTTNH